MPVLSSIFVVTCIYLIRPITGQSILKGGLGGEELNCGVRLAALTSTCASVKHSNSLYCCGALKAWNNGFCWCDTNAFKAASNLAMDFFAFQFRVNTCNITQPFRPEISLPAPSKERLPSTCPDKAPSEVEKFEVNMCKDGKFKSRLRDSRMRVLERLSNLNVLREVDIATWSKDLDTIFVTEAVVSSLGMFFSFPRVNVKKTLLTRSTLYGGALWKSTIDRKSIFWRSSNSISYISESSYGPFGYSRVEFVLFEKGSPRIAHLFAQEEEAVRLFRQFVYLEPSDRILWRTRRSPMSWCREISRTCGPKLSPFRGLETCLRVYREFRSAKTTCTARGPRSSLTALHGNTLACRNGYLKLARLSRERYCPLLGERGMGLCRQNGCVKSWYENVFKTRNPRFDSSVAYTCSSTDCSEEWPVQDGDTENVEYDNESSDYDYED